MCGQAGFLDFFQALAPQIRLLSGGCCPCLETGTNPNVDHSLWITNGLLEIYTQPCAELTDEPSEPIRPPFFKKQRSGRRRRSGLRLFCYYLLLSYLKVVVVVEGRFFCGQTGFLARNQALAPSETVCRGPCCRCAPTGTTRELACAMWITTCFLKSYTQRCAKKRPAGAPNAQR